MVMFINSKITNITINTLFTNPENEQEIVSFIEIDKEYIQKFIKISNNRELGDFT